jgi:RNA-directed DNA polymerase
MPKAQEAGWSKLDWSKIQSKVTKLQSKIYQASCNGDKPTVVKYQQMLVNSYTAKLLAVKRVTQDSRGKAAAGVDGEKSLSPESRITLANQLELDEKAEPLVRVEIPKSDGSKISLGIPTLKERAKQALAKLALEPEWEALFEPNSYGFRPGRSGHDAVGAIELAVRRKATYILAAEINNCFDNLNQEYLIRKINTYPKMEKQIRVWLRLGILTGDVFFKTEKGTPEGNVISPLLANIALHGLETYISNKFPQTSTKSGTPEGKNKEIGEARLIRYADNFVVIHEDCEVINQCKEEIENWFQEVGLFLHPRKTRICHTLNEYKEEGPGFDFLGFNIRTYPASKYQSNTESNGEGLMITKVKPSEQSEREFLDQIKGILAQGHDKKPELMIKRLNWLIREWGNYFKSGSHSFESFGKLQNTLYKIYLNWGKKRFSKRGLGYIIKKIFHKGNYSNWTFGWQDATKLTLSVTLSEFRYEKYIKVPGVRTPYDGDWLYWVRRRGENPETPKDLKIGIKKQEGKCFACKMIFQVDDIIEIHQVDKNRKNNNSNNKVLVHNHCHDKLQKMSAGLGETRDGTV